jgi:hypothetical protein
MRVGVVRTCACWKQALRRSPHARGDGPYAASRQDGGATFSPRAGGWSRDTARRAPTKVVPPTRAPAHGGVADLEFHRARQFALDDEASLLRIAGTESPVNREDALAKPAGRRERPTLLTSPCPMIY